MASQSNDQELREIFGLAPGQGDNGILEFGATEYSQTENGLLVAAIKVLRRGPLTGSPSATIALRDGTAVAGSDYLKEPISVQFLPGEVEKTITIPLVDDAVVEDVESLTLTLQNPKNGAGIGPQATATLKVLDNDGAAIIESRPSVAGSPLPIDSVDVFLPPGGEVLLEVTVTVPAEGGEPVTSVRPLSREPRAAQTVSLPLDVFLLQDLSGSFEDDIDVLQGDPASGRAGLAENLVTQLQSLRPDTTFGLGSFVDKPIGFFGDAADGDYVYRLEQPQSLDGKRFQQTVQGLTTRVGGDVPESQLEALLLLARQSGTTGFRSGARRVVVVSTDAPYHQAGDFLGAPPNNGDGVSSGSPQGTGEDYPSVQQVKNALIEADLLPIFAVTEDELATYRDLVDDSDGDGFGFGSVVQLERDSSNLTKAITEGLGNVGREINIFAISDEAKRVKEILPAKFTGVQAGETKKFVVRLQSDGLGSDDSLILRALGYGDIKVNIIQDPKAIVNPLGGLKPRFSFTVGDVNKPDFFVPTETDLRLKLASAALIRAGGGTAALFQPAAFRDLVETRYGEPDQGLLKGADGKPLNESERRVELQLVGSDGKPKATRTDTKTWIVIHGWNDSTLDINSKLDQTSLLERSKANGFAGNLYDLANSLATANPNDNVYVLDWSAASFNGKTKSGDGNDILALRDLGNYAAAKWIRPIAEKVVEVLSTAGMTAEYAKSSLNLVGHSLGSLMANEIARVWQEKGKSGPGVSSIIALDPPSQTNLSLASALIPGVGYDVDGRTVPAEGIKGDSGVYLPNFSETAEFSRAFVGSRSVAGNQLFAQQAEESIAVDFTRGLLEDADFGDEHTFAYQTFTELLSKPETYGELSGLTKPRPFSKVLNPPPNYKNDGYSSDLATHDAGLITSEPSDKKTGYPTPQFLTFVQDGKSDKDDIVYGTAKNERIDTKSFLELFGDGRIDSEGNDLIEAGKGNDEVFAGGDNDTINGGEGNDTLEGEDGNDILLGGLGNDLLKGGSGNDTLTGGQGQDVLEGGFGSDVFVFEQNDLSASPAEADFITDYTKGIGGISGLGDPDRIAVSKELSLSGITVERINQTKLSLFDPIPIFTDGFVVQSPTIEVGGDTAIKIDGKYLAVLKGVFELKDISFIQI